MSRLRQIQVVGGVLVAGMSYGFLFGVALPSTLLDEFLADSVFRIESDLNHTKRQVFVGRDVPPFAFFIKSNQFRTPLRSVS